MKLEATIVRGLLYIAGACLLLAAIGYLRTGSLSETALRLPDTITAGLLGYLARELTAHPAPKDGPDA